jgi:6-phosphofructokinase
MDLRRPVLAIVCCGSPAPGMNGAISSVTLEATKQGAAVLGVYEGFRDMIKGRSTVIDLKIKDVTRIHDTGGCMLQTNRIQIATEEEADNVVRVLEFRRVRYLVTIGGTDTVNSVSKIIEAAKRRSMQLSVVHVPKTIYDDLPLPDGSHTFGFDTAQQAGFELVRNLQTDCRSMRRWYVVVVVGKKSGHLAMGIAKAAGATLSLLPEEFENRKVTVAELCDILEASIYKRLAVGKDYGVGIVGEGICNNLVKEDLDRLFDGDLVRAYKELGLHLANELNTRLGRSDHVVTRNLGNEVRGNAPTAQDTILARDLGFAAVRVLLEGATDCMIYTQGNNVVRLQLEDLFDKTTGEGKIRRVDRTAMPYQIAQSYQIRLRPSDLQDRALVSRLAAAAKMDEKSFASRFAQVAFGI